MRCALYSPNTILEIAMYIAIFLSEQGVKVIRPPCGQDRRRDLELYKTQIDKAARLGALTVPVGYLRGAREADDPLDAYYERLAESLQKLTDYSRRVWH